MLNYLKGTILAVKERYVILAVNDTIGYRIYTIPGLLEQLKPGDETTFYVFTYVREDALELYGFATNEELDFFERLIAISGVGPKTALGVLAVAPLSDIKKAIIHGDPTLLQKVSAIGKKTAERIILELKEKIIVSPKEGEGEMSITENIQLLEALNSLGYRDAEIRAVIRHIPAEKKELSERIKEALRLLSKH